MRISPATGIQGFRITLTKQHLYRIALLGLLAVVTYLPILLWGPFLFPIGDDLECAGWPAGWQALYLVPVKMWQTWGGCYTASFFRVLYAPLVKQQMLWATPLVFALLHVLGGAVLLRLCGVPSAGTAFVFSAIWGLCYFASMPAPAETTFWATGMLVYEPGNILAFVLTVLVSRSPAGDQKNIGVTPALWLIVPILVGCHFVFALWTLSLVGLRAWERKWRRSDLALLVWCLLWIALVFAAPGNFQRYEVRMEETTVTTGYVATRSLGSFVEFLVREISLVQNWTWLAMAAVLFVRRPSEETPEGRTPLLLIGRILAVTVPLLGIFVLSSMTREVPPPLRTLNAVHYLVMMGLAVLVIPAVMKPLQANGHQISWIARNAFFEKVVVLSLALAILSPNYVRCFRELLTAAPEYRQYWDDVQRRVADAKRRGLTRVEIPTDPERRPVTVFHPSFLGSDSQAWPNRDYAKFFGVAEIVAVDAD